MQTVLAPPKKRHHPRVDGTGAAYGGGMDAVTFRLKRAHWSAVGFGKRALEGVDHMTPARFDFLYALRMNPNRPSRGHGYRRGFAMNQNEVRAKLGVHRSTVSKMLLRLLQLRWVRSQPDPRNRRTNRIELTKVGYAAFDLARRVTLCRRVHRAFFHDLFRRRRRREPVVNTNIAIHMYVMLTAFIATEMGDTATLEYPLLWDPDI